MNDNHIDADSFVLESRGFRIYRVQQQGSGAILWLSRERLLRYLNWVQPDENRRTFKEW